MKLLRVDKIDDEEYIGFRLIVENAGEEVAFEYTMNDQASCCETYSVSEKGLYTLIGKELISIRSYNTTPLFDEIGYDIKMEIVCVKSGDCEAFIYFKNEHNGFYPHTCNATYLFKDGKIQTNEFQL